MAVTCKQCSAAGRESRPALPAVRRRHASLSSPARCSDSHTGTKQQGKEEIQSCHPQRGLGKAKRKWLCTQAVCTKSKTGESSVKASLAPWRVSSEHREGSQQGPLTWMRCISISFSAQVTAGLSYASVPSPTEFTRSDRNKNTVFAATQPSPFFFYPTEAIPRACLLPRAFQLLGSSCKRWIHFRITAVQDHLQVSGVHMKTPAPGSHY